MSENYSMECCLGADDSGFSSPGFCNYESIVCTPEDMVRSGESSRRGRPKAATITNLIKEGATSRSGIRCEICSRVFPRDKSLQAHLRVHTGERPYSCDYPGCVRKFKQSGQLKTHQRLHTGERPFLCSAQGCENRFTHANRHCSSHPAAALVRSDDFVPHNPDTAQSDQVRQWLIRYMTEKREPRSEKKVKNGESKMSDKKCDEVPNGTELSDMTNLTPPQHDDIQVYHHRAVRESLLLHLRSPVKRLRFDSAEESSPPPQSHLRCRLLRSPSVRRTSPSVQNDLLYSPGSRRTPCQQNDLLRSPVSRDCFNLYTPSASTTYLSTIRYDDLYEDVCSGGGGSETDEETKVSLTSLRRCCVSDTPVGWSTPLATSRHPSIVSKTLFTDSPPPTLSPRKRELPKKRWLRIARREEECTANLRRPTVLRYLSASEVSPPTCLGSTPTQLLTPPQSACRHDADDDSGVDHHSPTCRTSPLLSRLLMMPTPDEEHAPLAVPLPHD